MDFSNNVFSKNLSYRKCVLWCLLKRFPALLICWFLFVCFLYWKYEQMCYPLTISSKTIKKQWFQKLLTSLLSTSKQINQLLQTAIKQGQNNDINDILFLCVILTTCLGSYMECYEIHLRYIRYNRCFELIPRISYYVHIPVFIVPFKIKISIILWMK